MITVVKCPTCAKEVRWTPENRFRPFCSERCKLIDLGNWVSGRYAIPAEEAPGEIREENQDS